MFYSQFILAKKGPLGTIWIAAHLERKLRKNQVADTDIGVSVDSILFPEVPIALRLSSHLLLGVVRIYSRKVNYLFDDCSEALLKVRQAFRSTAVDLPPEESKAPYHSITLPETFDLDDFELPDTEIFQGNFVDHHVSSKDQITLQDTMEGVVYSTSQFGPDERFGDGDTSQIGLDLDEELLFEKGASSGHGVLLGSCGDPQSSVEPSSNLKGDERNEETDDASKAPANTVQVYDRDSDWQCYGCGDEFEGPSTPGLLEEPNLPSSQQAQVSEDHMEEDHNLAEPVTKEVSEIAPGQVDTAINLTSVLPNGCIEASKDLEVESVQDDSVSKSEPHGASTFQSEQESREAQTVAINGSLAPSYHSHKAADSSPVKTSVNGFCTTLSESISEMDKSLDHTGISTCVEADRELEYNSMEQRNIVQKNQALRPEDPEITNHHATASMESAGKPLLQSCNRHSDIANDKEAPAVSLAEMQEVNDLTVNGNQALDTALCKVANEDPNKLDGEVDNKISGDAQKEKDISATISDLPSPEKMLSLPPVPISQDMTPEKEGPAEGGQDITANKISGKKRSFTESTVTLQSLNSVESSEAAQSKSSVEFVPGDDDLLSSILVGRRSTALKLKPTPPASELVSSKRPRVGSRSGAHKRKALVDDSMVLHGDTIREQLVNTEDIRRVRKKAPSTRPEIWRLQKQFLKDEIFSEPLFTGMPTELIWLHCQPFDQSGTKIIRDDGSKFHFTATEMTGSSPSRTTNCEHTEFDGNCTVARDGGHEQSLEVTREVPIQLGVMVSSEVDDDKTQKETTESRSGNENLQISIQEEKTEMDINRIALVDVEADQSVTLEVQFPSSLHHGSEDNVNLTNDAIVPSAPLKETAQADVLITGTCEKLDEQCIAEGVLCQDASTVVRSCGQGVDTNTVDKEHRSEEGNLTMRTEVDSVVATTSSLTDSALPVHDENTIGDASLGCGRLEPTSDQVLTEGRSDEPGMENKDEVHSCDARYDSRSPALDHLLECSMPDSSIPTEGNLCLGNAILVEGAHLEADHKIPLDAAVTTTCEHGLLEQSGDFEADVVEHDTGFLNYDDDEIAEGDDDSMVNAEGTQILDNSGWSTRTRAVANYLQTLFREETQPGTKALYLDSLLAGKSRKEASRMFFETLVLKTRDYIQAEQEESFGKISVKPRVKLMKSEF